MSVLLEDVPPNEPMQDWHRALAALNIAFGKVLDVANKHERQGDMRVTEAFQRTLVGMARDCLIREQYLSWPHQPGSIPENGEMRPPVQVVGP